MEIKLHFEALTTANWQHFEALFGARGACGGCWCMTWRLRRKEYEQLKGDGNKDAMHDLVKNGNTVGILGFAGSHAVGWCSLGPRDDFTRLASSRILRPVDDTLVWSIVCFYIRKDYRKQGILSSLILGAAAYAREQGATVLEAYPIDPAKDSMPDVFAFTGIASAFLKAGFREVARNAATRPVMRLLLCDGRH